MSGHIALHRKAFAHPLLKDGERFRAWFWMVSRACWKQTRYDIAGRTIALERGQFCCSIRELAAEWGWSKSAVDRFLTRLKTETMIGTDSGTGKLVITICNYEEYQAPSNQSGTAIEPPTGTPAGQRRDIKEEGNNTSPNGEGVPPVDTAKAIFDLGVALLTASGHDERAARSLLGRWRKNHGDGAVYAALLDCRSKNISQPVEWITKRLSSLGNTPGDQREILMRQAARYAQPGSIAA